MVNPGRETDYAPCGLVVGCCCVGSGWSLSSRRSATPRPHQPFRCGGRPAAPGGSSGPNATSAADFRGTSRRSRSQYTAIITRGVVNPCRANSATRAPNRTGSGRDSGSATGHRFDRYGHHHQYAGTIGDRRQSDRTDSVPASLPGPGGRILESAFIRAAPLHFATARVRKFFGEMGTLGRIHGNDFRPTRRRLVPKRSYVRRLHLAGD